MSGGSERSCQGTNPLSSAATPSSSFSSLTSQTTTTSSSEPTVSLPTSVSHPLPTPVQEEGEEEGEGENKGEADEEAEEEEGEGLEEREERSLEAGTPNTIARFSFSGIFTTSQFSNTVEPPIKPFTLYVYTYILSIHFYLQRDNKMLVPTIFQRSHCIPHVNKCYSPHLLLLLPRHDKDSRFRCSLYLLSGQNRL